MSNSWSIENTLVTVTFSRGSTGVVHLWVRDQNGKVLFLRPYPMMLSDEQRLDLIRVLTGEQE